jgi:hypothetical protein
MAQVVVLSHHLPGRTEESKNNLSQSRQFLGRDLFLAPPENDARVLLGQPRRSAVPPATPRIAQYLLHAPPALRYKEKTRIFAAGLRQHWFRAPQGPMAIFLFFPRPYMCFEMGPLRQEEGLDFETTLNRAVICCWPDTVKNMHFSHRVHLCVSCDSQNEQRLFS